MRFLSSGVAVCVVWASDLRPSFHNCYQAGLRLDPVCTQASCGSAFRIVESSAPSCVDRCRRTPDCEYVTWNHTNNQCRLLGAQVKAERDDHYVSVFKGCVDPTVSQKSPMAAEPSCVERLAIKGTVIREARTPSVLECGRVCNETKECVGFSWDRRYRQCRLVSEISGIARSRYYYSGRKDCFQPTTRTVEPTRPPKPTDKPASFIRRNRPRPVFSQLPAMAASNLGVLRTW